MNRAQRRNKKKLSTAEFNKMILDDFKNSAQVKAMLNEAYQAGHEDGFWSGIAVFIYELRNIYGFGQERVNRLMRKVIDLGDSLDKELVNMKDIHEVLKTELGIEIVRTDNGVKYRDSTTKEKEGEQQ